MAIVSVVIPTYNRAHMIGRCIRSVISQTYYDFEILIIDDGSVDNTEQVIRSFKDPRIKYVRNQIQVGANAARNTGIKLAKGKYIAFLDDDDEWLQTKLFKQMAVMENASESIGAVYTGRIVIKSGKVVSIVSPHFQGNIISKLLDENCVGTMSTVMIRSKLLLQNGGLDEKLLSCQDWDLWLRIAERYEFACIPDILVKYHITEKSITSNIQKQLQGHLQLFNKHRKYYPNGLNQNNYLRLGELFCLSDNMDVGRRFLIHAFSLNFKNYNSLMHILLSLLGHSLFIKLHSMMEKTRWAYQ